MIVSMISAFVVMDVGVRLVCMVKMQYKSMAVTMMKNVSDISVLEEIVPLRYGSLRIDKLFG